MSKVISRLLWFCIIALYDWLTKLAPLSKPTGIQTKTNRVSPHAFSRVWRQLHVFASNCDWLDVLFTSVEMARVITLVLFLRHSIGNRSNNIMRSTNVVKSIL